MAVITVLAGSLLGLAAALIALIWLNVGWLAALAIWSLGGVAMMALLLALAQVPRKRPEPEIAAETTSTPDFS